MPGSVLVIGSINADLVVTLDRLPEAGETVTGGRFARHGGGKGANQAVAAARAGARVRFAGAVGDDDLGAAALDELRSEGVDVGSIARLEGGATGVALIAVDREGRNQIAVASGANARVDAALVARALDAAPLGPGDVVLLGFEVPDEAVVAGARAAADAGARAILNPAPARPLPDEMLAHAVVLTPNGLEAATLTGETEPAAAARALVRRTGAAVIVTVGADGAVLATGDGIAEIPAPEVDVVDTTGAGDAFNGVLAAGLAAGEEVEEAARRAVEAASASVRRAGARG
jgi:ribokinase